MRKLQKALSFGIGSLISASAMAIDIPADLLRGSEMFYSYVKSNGGLNYNNCATDLDSIYKSVNKKNPLDFDRESAKVNADQITRNLWLARIELRNRLNDFVSQGHINALEEGNPCVSAVRNVTRAARFLEDYIAETFSGVSSYNEKTDPKKLVPTFTGEEPWLMLAPNHEKVTFRSGDIVISRGNAPTSAAIARSAEVDAQFSHLMMIYVKGGKLGQTYTIEEVKNNPNIIAVEAFIEVGSSIRPLQKYLEDGNARNMLFRFHSPLTAHKAAEHVYNYIENERTRRYGIVRALNPLNIIKSKSHPNFNVPYDFKLNLNDPSELNCVETGSMGYRSQNVNVPFFPSRLEDPKVNPMVRALGVENTLSFAPGDMEVDPQFEVVAEWRDLRKIGNARIKDAVLTAMFKWTKEHSYSFKSGSKASLTSGLGKLLRTFDFATDKLPKNMPHSLAVLMITLTETAEIIEAQLSEREEAYTRVSDGLKFTHSMMLDRLEQLRIQDKRAYETRQPGTHFHSKLR